MTMYRMRLRENLLLLTEAVLGLREGLLAVAGEHRGTIFAAHTHTQPAQPTTVAHYLLGVIEQLERDTARLAAAYEVVNVSPLGACAITGTGFPIDRDRTSALLGFSGPTGNTYGSIATADFVLQATAMAGVLLVGLGRFVQDMLLWASVELGYLRLPDGFVQVSSVMPQKRNPVALEHARSLASRALGQMNAVAAVVHNTPFGDIVDTEDDLQPLVDRAFRDARRAVALTAATMAGAEFNVAHMRTRAGAEWVTVTELADTLTRQHGMPFTTAHAIVSALVRRPGSQDVHAPGAALTDAARELGHDVRLSDEDLRRILSPEHFVAVRRTLGGPAPDVTREAVAQSRARLDADRADTARVREALAAAGAARRAALAMV
jgi:argininosuccinate lyase